MVFKVKCSKGTYIRSLCEDIAKKLDNVGYMKELERTEVDDFTIDDSYSLEEIETKEVKLITIEAVFKKNEEINLTEKELKLFLNGVQITKIVDDNIYRIYCNQNFIGLGIVKNNLLKRDIVIV